MNRAREILVGIATVIGIIAGLIAVVAPLLTELQQELVNASVDPLAYVLGGGAIAGIAVVGRIIQAVTATLKDGKTDGQRARDEAARPIPYPPPVESSVAIGSAYPEPPQQADGAPTPAAGADGDGS